MNVKFQKYHGNGNDFVLIDNRAKLLARNLQKTIQRLCSRRFGIGADGLIMIQNLANYDFEMKYFNADGYLGSMCGNGARCAVAYARTLGIKPKKKRYRLMASDGEHIAQILPDGLIKLSMGDVKKVEPISSNTFELHTGSPHYVALVESLATYDVERHGKEIRHSKKYVKAGINVNYIQSINGVLHVRTYERGVEAETLSCGTGVTAAAIVHVLASELLGESNVVNIETLGGKFQVYFSFNGEFFYDIHLQAPATFVYNGEVEL